MVSYLQCCGTVVWFHCTMFADTDTSNVTAAHKHTEAQCKENSRTGNGIRRDSGLPNCSSFSGRDHPRNQSNPGMGRHSGSTSASLSTWISSMLHESPGTKISGGSLRSDGTFHVWFQLCIVKETNRVNWAYTTLSIFHASNGRPKISTYSPYRSC